MMDKRTLVKYIKRYNPNMEPKSAYGLLKCNVFVTVICAIGLFYTPYYIAIGVYITLSLALGVSAYKVLSTKVNEKFKMHSVVLSTALNLVLIMTSFHFMCSFVAYFAKFEVLLHQLLIMVAQVVACILSFCVCRNRIMKLAQKGKREYPFLKGTMLFVIVVSHFVLDMVSKEVKFIVFLILYGIVEIVGAFSLMQNFLLPLWLIRKYDLKDEDFIQ